MTWRARAALIAASVVYSALVVTAIGELGASYEEVVPYVLTPLDIRESPMPGVTAVPEDDQPWFVTSAELPRLAFAPMPGVRLPLLNQSYMTDHLSYGGVVLARFGIEPLWAARLWHAAFGVILLWLLYDVGLLLGLAPRAAWLAVALAATSLQLTFMYAWARFDESLPSWGAVAVLWAALHHSRDGRDRWIWIAVLAAALSVSAKLTASWPLLGLACAAAAAGWRPPPLAKLARPALAAAPLFLPMVGFAVTGPSTGQEVGRRIGFLTDLFTSGTISITAANLIDYLGSWGRILTEIVRGADVRAPNIVGRLLVLATLIWLFARALMPGTPPRWRRLETQMLIVLGVVFTLVALFYREHRDYQFVLLVPLSSLALATFLERGAQLLDRRLPAWFAAAIVCAVPVGANLWEQRSFREDLMSARNAMLDLYPQWASASWLADHNVHRPIVVTFYAVGTYELFTNSLVQPVYPFPLLRHANEGGSASDMVGTWRELVADADEAERFAVIPVGENPVEARHFEEPAIRAAMLEAVHGERVAVFTSRRGDPLLEVWHLTPR